MKICVGCALSGVVELVYAPATAEDAEAQMRLEQKLSSKGKISEDGVYQINGGFSAITNFSDVEEAKAFLAEECDPSSAAFLSLVA